MADNTPDTDQPEGDDAPQTDAVSKTPLISRVLQGNWVAKLLALLILVHGLAYVYYGYRRSSATTSRIYEISLGSYRFDTDGAGDDRVAGAQFRLYVSLLSEVDQAGRALIKTHKYKVQQDIEELLRQAHSGDFDDPLLGELKRQLQEQINHALGMRVVDEVIITNLTLQQHGKAAEGKVRTAESVPWEENPSS